LDGDRCGEIFLEGDEIVLHGEALTIDEVRVKLKPPQREKANRMQGLGNEDVWR